LCGAAHHGGLPADHRLPGAHHQFIYLILSYVYNLAWVCARMITSRPFCLPLHSISPHSSPVCFNIWRIGLGAWTAAAAAGTQGHQGRRRSGHLRPTRGTPGKF
jgi:hypothetical protein